MKKLIFFRLRSRIFKGFLISVSGLVFLTLNLVMILSFKHISGNMRAEEIRILENKLYTIAEDMEDQLDNMSRIVMKIAFHEKFSLDYIQEDKYHEKEVADIFQNYNSFSDIAKDYFLLYDAYDKLFTSAGTTISPETFFSAKHGLATTEELMKLLDSLYRESKHGIYLYREGDVTLFLYPLQVYTSVSSGRQGVVGFLASSAEIDRRVERIAGKIYGDMRICYDDFCIYGQNEDTDFSKEDAFDVDVKVKEVQIYARADENRMFSWKNVFSVGEIGAFAVIIVLLLLCIYVVTWWNYLPVHKIMKKYALTVKEGESLGWEDIDRLIELLLHEREASEHLVKTQLRILREQAVSLIVTDGYSDSLQNHLSLLNIKVDFSVFGILCTQFQKEQGTDEYDEVLYQNIEELSGKEVKLYAYWSNEGKLQILVAAEEEYQLDEAAELLQSLLETLDIHTEVALGAKCRDLNQLHLAGKEGDGGKTEVPAEPEKNETRRSTGKQKNTAKQVVEYIQAHCTDYNISLDMIAQELQLTPPYLCTILKQEIGMSYKEYLTKLRIEEAKKLLMEEYISVADICQRVGYASVSYFIKIFQKHTGVTPTRYRTEYQEEQSAEG